MLVFAREVSQLLRLDVRHSERIDPALAGPVIVDVEHDLRRGLAIPIEYPFQHVHDELHRAEVIVEQQHPEHGGTPQLTNTRPFIWSSTPMFSNWWGTHGATSIRLAAFPQ